MVVRIVKPKLLFCKVLLIFAPVFSVAYFTQDMVYVLPTLAIGVFAGSSFKQNESDEVSEAEIESND